MSNHGTASRVEGSYVEFQAAVLRALPRDIDPEVADNWTRNGESLAKELRKVLVPPNSKVIKNIEQQLTDWITFYKKHFNLTLDASELSVPTHQKGFNRLIVVAQGLTCNQAYEACAKQFSCWRYTDDLDAVIPINYRDPQHGAYAIRVRDRVEADEENKSQSADHRKEQGCIDQTLLERILHELKFFDETGKHLDIENVTLCAGSRDSVGRVPGASWYFGEFSVSWYRSGDSGDRLRARSVVSLAAKPSESVAQQT